MKIQEIWRYPVKSMAGEPLAETVLGENGIPGDRGLLVVDAGGHIATARRYPKLLGMQATLDAEGQVKVDGQYWEDPEVAKRVEQAVAPGARLVPWTGPERFDILPLLVATDGAIAHLGFDRRRFRPNLLIQGVPGLAERDWEDRILAIGDARVHLVDLRGRCVMTTFDPDTQVQDPTVLRRIVRELDGVLGLNATVRRPGLVAVGDAVGFVAS